MLFANYHTHTTFSDGAASPEQYVKSAIESGMQAIGFSDHAPFPLGGDWPMAESRLKTYLKAVQQLKTRYAGQIEIYCGLEIDYYPGSISPADALFQGLELDYIIGAVHFVDAFDDGTPWCVDGSASVFKAGVNTLFGGDIREAVNAYFSQVREMIRSSKPTIVAHLDRLRRNTYQEDFSCEDTLWYKAQLQKTLEVIAENKCILEVNTKDFQQGRNTGPYPGNSVLSLARSMNIPVHLAADAHRPHEIQRGFLPGLKLIQDSGYQHIQQLRDGAWKAVSIEEIAVGVR